MTHDELLRIFVYEPDMGAKLYAGKFARAGDTSNART